MFTMTCLSYARLKILQITLVVIAGFAGFLSGLLFGKVGNHFQKNCLLYANLSISVTRNINITEVHVKQQSTWGNSHHCDLVTFEGVLVFINSFVWLWFYLHMENIIRVDVSETSLHRSNIDARGFASLQRIGNRNREQYDGCKQLQDSHWIFLSTFHARHHAFAFHDAMQVALIMSWLEPLVLATHVLVILAHVYFQANQPPQPTPTVKTTGFSSSKPPPRFSKLVLPLPASAPTCRSHSVDNLALLHEHTLMPAESGEDIDVSVTRKSINTADLKTTNDNDANAAHTCDGKGPCDKDVGDIEPVQNDDLNEVQHDAKVVHFDTTLNDGAGISGDVDAGPKTNDDVKSVLNEEKKEPPSSKISDKASSQEDIPPTSPSLFNPGPFPGLKCRRSSVKVSPL